MCVLGGGWGPGGGRAGLLLPGGQEQRSSRSRCCSLWGVFPSSLSSVCPSRRPAHATRCPACADANNTITHLCSFLTPLSRKRSEQ